MTGVLDLRDAPFAALLGTARGRARDPVFESGCPSLPRVLELEDARFCRVLETALFSERDGRGRPTTTLQWASAGVLRSTTNGQTAMALVSHRATADGTTSQLAVAPGAGALDAMLAAATRWQDARAREPALYRATDITRLDRETFEDARTAVQVAGELPTFASWLL